MGKKSKYPAYSTGAVKINGRTVATASKNGNTVSTNYNMSDAEKQIQNSIQNNMATSLNNLFDISDIQRNQWDNQLKAMKTQGIQNINDIYTPMETSLRNNIASRFGNLDNSAFMSNLNKITDKKAKAISDLGNSLALAQNDLYTQELTNRMNVLSFLGNFNTQLNNNMLNYMSAAASNSGAGNSYNSAAYQASSGNSPWSGFANTALNIVSKKF